MKIVCLSPSLTEIVIDLGAKDLLAGITNHCPEPHPGITRLGPAKALQIEMIRALEPDLILADQNENRPELIRDLTFSKRTEIFDVRSPDSAAEAVVRIAHAVSKREAGTALAEEIRREQQENRRGVRDLRPVRVLLLLWTQPYLTVSFDTYPSRLLESCGGLNVFHEEPVREFPLDLEDMIEKNPELLLLPGDPYPFQRRHIASFRQYRVFSTAVIERIDGMHFSRYGRRTAQALRFFRELLLKMTSNAPVQG